MSRTQRVWTALVIVSALIAGACSDSSGPTSATREDAEAATDLAPAPPPPPIVIQPTPTAASLEPDVAPLRYTIEEGDLLGSIAVKFNTTIEVILRANPGLDPNVLGVGQEIIVPGATTDPTAQSGSADREPGETVSYFVEAGDLYSTIADEYQVSVQAIIDANPDVDPAALGVGQELTIPPIGTGLSSADVTGADPDATPEVIEREIGEPQRYVVQPGDVIESIAATFEVTVDDIISFNNIIDPTALQVGQELVIPPPTSGEE